MQTLSPFCKTNFRECKPSILKCLYGMNLFNSWSTYNQAISASLFFTKHKLLKNWFFEGLIFWITLSDFLITLVSFLFKVMMCRIFCCLGSTRNGILNTWTISKCKFSLVKISRALWKYFFFPAMWAAGVWKFENIVCLIVWTIARSSLLTQFRVVSKKSRKFRTPFCRQLAHKSLCKISAR